jgi:hypothetical protein
LSTALAIAGVTATLKDLLNNGMIDGNVSGLLGSSVLVTDLPLDRVAASGSQGPQLNLFLHRITFNTAYRNEGLPSHDRVTGQRIATPPLALDLHFLLTVHGDGGLEREILAGYAMQLLHQTPVLPRSAIRRALDPSQVSEELPLTLRELGQCGLAEQLEQIKITPEVLGGEELSNLWTAVQSPFRLTLPYLVTVVLIESPLPSRASLPVLSRGPVDPMTARESNVAVTPSLLPALPTLESVALESLDSVATVGGRVELGGHHLDGTNQAVVLSSVRLGVEQSVAVEPGASSTRSSFLVPALPVGVYELALNVTRPGESRARTSNRLALLLGPAIKTPLPMSARRDARGKVELALSCEPALQPRQAVSLLLGSREVVAAPVQAPSTELFFEIEDAPLGEQLLRLRVDGIESPIVNRKTTPPTFFDHKVIIT